jgi:hypothetical protein
MSNMHKRDDPEVATGQRQLAADLTKQDELVSKDRIWDQLRELREEVRELQKTRAQIIGFKITAVAGGLAILSSLHGEISSALLLLPAFAAIFFDFLITSQSVGIKRIGFYIATELEPFLKRSGAWPEGVLCWEEYMSRRSVKQSYSLVGNLGFTLLVAAGASTVFAASSPAYESVPIILVLVALLLYDTLAFLRPRRIVENRSAFDV